MRSAWRFARRGRSRRIRDSLELLPTHAPTEGLLVDVGGGVGIGAAEEMRIAPRGAYARALVIDPQKGMIQRAVPRIPYRPRLEPVVAGGNHLPLPDKSVDVLLSLGVLCCMKQEAVPRAVAELWRVLRPGGYCVLQVPNAMQTSVFGLFRSRGFRKIGSPVPNELESDFSLHRRPVLTR
ncbi:MAG: class I SAM-dependent methyltransferase [Thermoplasmata archaeon]|nr:class I SAM-dependent methyltransferase [Thermoplasmata archaeon]